MVRKKSRCLALASLLALLLLLPTSPLQAGEHAPAERVPAETAKTAETATWPWGPLEGLWQAISTAACAHGVPVSLDGTCVAPGTLTSCEKGPLIDPNGRCTN